MNQYAIFKTAGWIAALLLITSSTQAAGTAETCQAAQLNAAAKLVQSVFACESKYVATPTTDPSGIVLEACKLKVAASFQKTYNASIKKAVAAGSACPQSVEGVYLDRVLLGDLSDVASRLRTGWNSADAISNKMYAALYKAVGTYFSAALKAEAKNVVTPAPVTLAAAHTKATVALQDAALSAGTSKPQQVTSTAQTALKGVVHLLGGNLLPTHFAVGDGSVCAVLQTGTLKCWGNNGWGNLGLGDTTTRGDSTGEMGDNLPAVPLETGDPVRAVAVGGGFVSCAILDDSSLKCWGANNSGELGLGDTSARGDNPAEMAYSLPKIDVGTGRSVRQVVTGVGVCAILDNGSLKCWGGNSDGELGQGDTTNRGDNPGEMGDNLPEVDLGTGRQARQISHAYAHVCALLDNGSVKCWGSNSSGQLGLGDTASRGDNPGEMGDNLPAVDLGAGHTARQVVAGGGDQTCVLLDDYNVKCWGDNSGGQLGLGDTTNRGDNANETGDNLPVVNLGSGRSARQIGIGWHHTCALLDDGSVKCWGANNNGELGAGDTIQRGDGIGEMGDDLPTVDLGAGRSARQLAVMAYTACALLDNGALKCWGLGGLGQGDTNARGDNANEMGFYLPSIDLGSLGPL